MAKYSNPEIPASSERISNSTAVRFDEVVKELASHGTQETTTIEHYHLPMDVYTVPIEEGKTVTVRHSEDADRCEVEIQDTYPGSEQRPSYSITNTYKLVNRQSFYKTVASSRDEEMVEAAQDVSMDDELASLLRHPSPPSNAGEIETQQLALEALEDDADKLRYEEELEEAFEALNKAYRVDYEQRQATPRFSSDEGRQ